MRPDADSTIAIAAIAHTKRTAVMLPSTACSRELFPAPTRPTTPTSSPGLTEKQGTDSVKASSVVPTW